MGQRVLLGLLAAAFACAPTGASAAGPTIPLNDNAYLHLVKRIGATLLEQGTAYGQARGHFSCRLRLGRQLSGTFELSSGGILVGRFTAQRHRGKDGFESFRGTAQVVGRSGRFRAARGTLPVYGTLDRRNRSVVFQLRGGIVG